MARVFARLMHDGATVCELIQEREDIAQEYTPEFLATQCAEVTGDNPMPQVGWIKGADGKFAPPPPLPTPTLAQRAQAALRAGLTITLSGSVTLAATVFPADAAAQQKLAAIAATVGATGGFPGDATTMPLRDAAGEWHTFDLAQWKAVAGAIAAYAAELQLIIDGNPLRASDLPPDSISLTI